MNHESSQVIVAQQVASTVYDSYIIKIRSLIEDWSERDESVRCFEQAMDAESLLRELPITVGPGAQTGVILRKNTYVELGNPSAGSCAFPLWSQDSGVLHDGRTTLVGPDFNEREGESLAFAQVLLVAGSNLTYAHHSRLEQLQYVGDQVEGYMIRSAPGRIWSRISRDVMEKGFGFEMLGQALMSLYRRGMPEIESMELVFITASKAAVEQIGSMADAVRSFGNQFIRQEWLDRGIDLDDCMEHDCTSCHEKEDCDDIRDVVQLAQQAKRERKRQKTVAAQQILD